MFFGFHDFCVESCQLEALHHSAVEQGLDMFPGIRPHAENFNPRTRFYLTRSLHLEEHRQQQG